MKRSRELALWLGALTLLLGGCSDDAASTDANAVPAGNGVCLPVNQIDRTDILDDSAILFYMKDGKTWLNTMRFPCPSLKIEGGFTYQPDTQEICSNAQTIRVVPSGGLCELGQFTRFTPPPMPAPAVAPPPAAN